MTCAKPSDSALAAGSSSTPKTTASAAPANLHTAERSSGLEDDQDAPRVPSQVAQLHITFGDHDLNGGIVPAEPNRTV